MRSLVLCLAGRAVVEDSEVIISSQKTRHLPDLFGKLGTGLGVDVKQTGAGSQSIVGHGDQCFSFA